MAELQYSKLLTMILEKAESLGREYGCKGATRDFIVVAAVQILSHGPDGVPADEARKARDAVSRYSSDSGKLASAMESWRGREPSMTERIMMTRYKGEAVSRAKQQNLPEVTADLFLQVLTESETAGMASLRDGAAVSPAPEKADMGLFSKGSESSAPAEPKKPEATAASAAPAASAEEKPSCISSNNQDLSSIVARTQHLQMELQKSVLGQSHAISVFTAGYFNAELQAAIDQNRKRPRGTFLFAGPPGVGKTFLAERAADILDLRFKRFDMSGYISPSAPNELCGYDKNYQTSKEGELTGFVNKYPECVLIFDEIEKSSMEVILLFLQIL